MLAGLLKNEAILIIMRDKHYKVNQLYYKLWKSLKEGNIHEKIVL